MDPLAGFLDGPRARRAFLLRSVMEPPWSLRIADEAPVAVVAVVGGVAWLVPDDAEPQRLATGDVAIVRGPDPYTVADRPDRPPRALILPGEVCSTLDGEPLTEFGHLGVRSWGNCVDGSTTLLTGTYEADGQISRRLLDVLPSLIVHRAATGDSPLVDLLAEEITKDEPGQTAVLDRLLDLVLVGMLRAWFAGSDGEAAGRFVAYADPVVGRALRLLEHDPAQSWTVASLGAAVGVSRAAMARRFRDLVGESPMAFLTDLRLAMASDLLLAPDATVSGVAAQVGYASPFTFSTAFKRCYGVSPRAHRARQPLAS